MTAPESQLASGWRAEAPAERRRARARLRRLARTLEDAQGTPHLGNHADPLDEAAYILLTYQTDIPRARRVWSDLRTRFPSWEGVLEAPEAVVAEILRPSGFHRARARLMRQLLAAVRSRFGVLSLDSLAASSTLDAEAVLRALPGLDTKGARCVLLYALGRPVFPVDSNSFRFFQRYGVVARTARYRRKRLHDELQQVVPPSCRHSLHVNLVAHGAICAPQAPACRACPVRRTCQFPRKGEA